MQEIKELPQEFKRGFGSNPQKTFTLYKKGKKSYVYFVKSGLYDSYFEVFERKLMYASTYEGKWLKSENMKVCYPWNEAFGNWAFTTSFEKRALEIFELLEKK